MTSAPWRLRTLPILLALTVLACRERPQAAQVTAPRGEDVVPRRSLAEEPPEEPTITIDPRRLGSSGLLLRLCFSGSSSFDPEIYRIRVSKVRGGTAVCDIRSIKGARLWNEWEVGTVPPGFQATQCDKLSPGEYEIYAQGVVGDGQIRLTIDPGGAVERLPWDEHDSFFRETCNQKRATPNFIPRMDAGLKEGGLSQRIRRAREQKERQNGSQRAPADGSRE